MRRSSLRTWLLLVSVLFAVLVIGGVAFTTYFVVSDGMSVVAHDSAVRVAHNASAVVKATVTEAQLEAAEVVKQPSERDEEALRIFLRQVPSIFRSAGIAEGEFAVYDDELEPIWFSDEVALVDEVESDRVRALELRHVTESTVAQGDLFRGLLGPADLGVYVVHVPLDLPGETRALLDVAYIPYREEAVIDGVRFPMAVLVVAAMLIMVVMMQTSMGWVLKLVDDLRKAADAIDAGNLDMRLPEKGEHEIGDLARSINGLIRRLRRRAEAQTRFVADASHELATPVAGIRGYTNILRAWGADDPDVREEAISAIDRESRRMARLCGDLLALVRDERAIEYRNVRFDLNARCRAILAGAATRYIDKDIEFIGPEEGQLIMIGDPDRIEDAISILVDNAAKYTAQGSVSLATRRRRDVVTVEVVDTGEGIPEDDIPNIFDRFYRSDVSRSQETGGFGLGLPIAKSIVEVAGGTIEVQSTEGKGTMFTLRLPRGRV